MPHYNTTRTISVPIFLRFALLGLEYEQWFKRQWPPGVLLDPRFPKRAADLSEKDLAQVVRQHDDALDFQRRFQALYLQHAGVPAEILQGPEMQAFLGLAAQNAVLATPPDGSWGKRHWSPRDDEFRFDRLLVHRVMAGAFLTFGRGSRSATFDFLNEGLPVGSRGVDYSHVRNSMDGVMRSLWRNAGAEVTQWKASMLGCAVEVQAAHALWRELGGQPGRSGAAAEKALLAMIDSGDFHDAFTAAQERAMTASSFPDVGPLKQQQRKRLRAELRNRDQENGAESQHTPGQAGDFHRGQVCEPCAR